MRDSFPAELSQVFLTLLISDCTYSCFYGPTRLKKPQFRVPVGAFTVAANAAFAAAAATSNFLIWYTVRPA